MDKCQFNDKWLDVWPWARKTADKHTIRCAMCLNDTDALLQEPRKIEKTLKIQ